MMPPDALDHRTQEPVTPTRPRRLISHAVTAASLCILSVGFDSYLRFEYDDTRWLRWIEMSLVVYGLTFAHLSFNRGGVLLRDRVILAICVTAYAMAGYVALGMPRPIHN